MSEDKPPQLTAENISSVVQVIFLKEGPPLLNYPTEDLALTVEMLSAGLAIVSDLMRVQKEGKKPEGRKIVPPTPGQVVDITRRHKP